MIKKVILIAICLILLNSCGRKNDLFETKLDSNFMTFYKQNHIFKISEKDEIYQ